MSETEYDIIDELYFVTAYQDLSKALNFEDAELKACLQDLLAKGYVKSFYPDPDQEIEFNLTEFNNKYSDYYYLATKAGLIWHNSR